MRILSILVIGVCGASVALLIRPIRPELSLLVGAVTGLILLAGAIADVAGVIDVMREIAQKYGLETEYIGVMLKIIGIAYASEFGVQVCKDAGEGAVAAKIELCGRVLTLAAALPAVLGILSAAAELIGGSVQ